MKRTAILLPVLILCLAACGKVPEAEQHHQEAPRGESIEMTQEENKEKHPAETTGQSMELVGPWHLDSEKNDLAAFENSLELFPGFGEWGAGMEIRSNGQMSWYIGAEGWHGSYTQEGGMIHAQLTSDLGQSAQFWDFRVTRENDTTGLEMPYKAMTIYWVYGDQEDIPPMGIDPEGEGGSEDEN